MTDYQIGDKANGYVLTPTGWVVDTATLPPPTLPEPRRRVSGKWVAVGVAAAVILGFTLVQAAVGSPPKSAATATPTVAPTPVVTVTATPEPAPTVTETVDPAPAVETVAPSSEIDVSLLAETVWSNQTAEDQANMCLIFTLSPKEARKAFLSGFTTGTKAYRESAWNAVADILSREC